MQPRQTQPKAASTASSKPPGGLNTASAPDAMSPYQEMLKSFGPLHNGPAASDTPQQTRRKRLQAAKTQVIDQYWPVSGTVTTILRASAKAALERELQTLPLEEFSLQEVHELAAGIRDRIYQPAFEEQDREAERRRTEQEARKQKELKAAAAREQAERRKDLLIEQALEHARKLCGTMNVTGIQRFSIVVEIEQKLRDYLTGQETLTEAYDAVNATIEFRLAEIRAEHEAAKEREEKEQRELWLYGGLLVGAVVLCIQDPQIMGWIAEQLRKIFGAMAPTPDPVSTEPSAATPSATASAPAPSPPIAPAVDAVDPLASWASFPNPFAQSAAHVDIGLRSDTSALSGVAPIRRRRKTSTMEYSAQSERLGAKPKRDVGA